MHTPVPAHALCNDSTAHSSHAHVRVQRCRQMKVWTEQLSATQPGTGSTQAAVKLRVPFHVACSNHTSEFRRCVSSHCSPLWFPPICYRYRGAHALSPLARLAIQPFAVHCLAPCCPAAGFPGQRVNSAMTIVLIENHGEDVSAIPRDAVRFPIKICVLFRLTSTRAIHLASLEFIQNVKEIKVGVCAAAAAEAATAAAAGIENADGNVQKSNNEASPFSAW